jgi:hypothetical protein
VKRQNPACLHYVVLNKGGRASEWIERVLLGGPTVSFIQPNAPTPYAYQWNPTIEHTIRDWLFEIGYLG